MSSLITSRNNYNQQSIFGEVRKMDQDISISHSTQEKKNKNIVYNLKTQGLYIICTNLIHNLYKSDIFVQS